MEKIADMLIVGSGPAGLGTALYAARAGLDAIVVEKTPIPGGQIINTTTVENYLGLPGIGGFEMGDVFKKHAKEMGALFAEDEILSIADENGIKVVMGKKEIYKAKTIVLAMGASHSKLGVEGEEKLIGRGVSYCATCDGAFFRNREVVVVGGGDVAVTDAIYLAGLCSKVTLIHRRDEFRAVGSLMTKLHSLENVNIITNKVVDRIEGNDFVEGISLRDTVTDEVSLIETSGVFIAIGMKPETDKLSGLPTLDDKGYICAGEDCITDIPGVYAVGDIRTKNVRQVITAVADGACAVGSAEKYLYTLQI